MTEAEKEVQEFVDRSWECLKDLCILDNAARETENPILRDYLNWVVNTTVDAFNRSNNEE